MTGCGAPQAASPSSSAAPLGRSDEAAVVATSVPRPADSVAPADSAAPAVSASPHAVVSAPTSACAEVAITLDLRALPVRPSASAVRAFGDGELDQFLNGAPPGPSPRATRAIGTAGFTVFFDAPRFDDAKVRCEAAVAAYLKRAPHLAGSLRSASGKQEMISAARVAVPCGKCG
jgi:hypothetical protein